MTSLEEKKNNFLHYIFYEIAFFLFFLEFWGYEVEKHI